ncbi:MAG: hypothetical protein ACFHX7_18050 [Pseudomonadota bacterium]
MKKLITSIALIGSLAAAPAFAELDKDSAVVSMDVALFAAITGLDDFVLSTSDTSGEAGAIYSGSDKYRLESNGQVRVALSGDNLNNGVDSIATKYTLDGEGVTFDTKADSVHNAEHTVSAVATLGDISSQKAGAYSSEIILTVSAL